MKVTRRKLARMLAATSVATAAVPAMIPTEVQAQTPASSDEETQSAHNQLRNNAQQLAKAKIPMATEPAFHFKA